MTKMDSTVITNNDKANDWWRGAVIYQIYPRSFQDSNGDGVGDLRGISNRLDYIANLGADAIWISPFFTSPMKDFGYDVSDYRDVDPMFGNLQDFDHLIAKAHKLGLKVMIDLVLSHTSDEHEWFKESRQSPDNDKENWYVWADAKPDGTPPNNWLSIFGGPAWTWDARRCQYYLHNFLTSQPDLNFHTPAVQKALLDVARFWLERGVDGFRLDTINFYFADKALRDNPALPPEARNDTIAPSVNPYNHQEHIYSKNQPENIDFLRKLRSVMEPYGAAAVGEVGDAQRGLEIMGQYTAGNDLMHMCYAFEFLAKNPLTAGYVADVLQAVETVAAEGWACWAFSNHDVMRHASRWQLTPEAMRLFPILISSLRGSVCLYQGEELGLEEAEVAFEDLQDPYGKQFWPEFKGRDGCRTPMVWQASNQQAGFSEAKPWLPVSPTHLPLNAQAQVADPDSLFSHYKAVLAFRADHAALKRGDIGDIRATGDLLSFTRMEDGATLRCIFNLGDQVQTFEYDAAEWRFIGTEIGLAQGAELGPWQGAILRQIQA
jgi:alpha-glucosidase